MCLTLSNPANKVRTSSCTILFLGILTCNCVAKTMRIVQDASTHPEASGPLHPELQFARCMSNRYKNEQFPRCVSCTRRWAGDTCRFQGIRFFLKDNNRNIVGISFVENQKPDAPTMAFPTVWNVPLHKGYISRTKVCHSIINCYITVVNPALRLARDRQSFTADSTRGTRPSPNSRNNTET